MKPEELDSLCELELRWAAEHGAVFFCPAFRMLGRGTSVQDYADHYKRKTNKTIEDMNRAVAINFHQVVRDYQPMHPYDIGATQEPGGRAVGKPTNKR